MGTVVKLPPRRGGREGREARQDRRHPFFMVVDYASSGRTYKDFIRNISAGGLFMESRVILPVGQEIAMSFSLPVSRGQIKLPGEIVRRVPEGMGVKFKTTAQRLRAELRSWGGPEFSSPAVFERHSTGVSKVGRVRRKRVRWEASLDPDVAGYRLYWSRELRVGYDSDSVDLGLETEVILPDRVPALFLLKGDVAIGITAVHRFGNESDMAKFTLHIDCTVPDAPIDLKVELLDGYYVPENPIADRFRRNRRVEKSR
jgi:hypothetical protein